MRFIGAVWRQLGDPLRTASHALCLALTCCAHAASSPAGSDAASPDVEHSPRPQQHCFWADLGFAIPFRVASSELDPALSRIDDALAPLLERFPGPLLRVQGYVALECAHDRTLWRTLAMQRALAVVRRLERLGASGQVEARADDPLSRPPSTDASGCATDGPYFNAQARLEAWVCTTR